MIFVDTDLLIDSVKEVSATLEFLAKLERERGGLATTSINVGEFLRGAARHGASKAPAGAEQVLRAFVEVPFGPRSARRFGEMMAELDGLGQSLPSADGKIAAIVLENGGRIATRNTRHFGNVPGLLVLSPDRRPAR